MDRRQKILVALASFYFGCLVALLARPVYAGEVTAGFVTGLVNQRLNELGVTTAGSYSAPSTPTLATVLGTGADANNVLVTNFKASSFTASVKTITSSDSPYTVLSTDYCIRADAASGAVTVNLPAVSSNRNRILVIKAVSVAGGNVTIARAGSDTIDGATSLTQSVQYQSETLQAPDTGVDWLRQ